MPTYYHVITDAQTGETTQIPFTAEEQAAHDARSQPKAEDYSAAIQGHVDATAQAREYADGVTLASYANSTNATWAAEAQAFISWRDAVWAYAYQELAKVQSGQRPVPTVAQIVSELPAIVWP